MYNSLLSAKVEEEKRKARKVVGCLFALNVNSSVLCWLAGAIEEALDIKEEGAYVSPSERKGRDAAILFLTEHGIEVK